MVSSLSWRTLRKENWFRHNPKRQRVDGVRELTKGCGRFARSVQLGECEQGYGYLNTLPKKWKNNGRLHSHRAGTDIVQDLFRCCDKVRPYSDYTTVSVRTPRKENWYPPNPKRPIVDVVQENNKDYESVARSVQLGEREEGFGDMNTLPKKYSHLHSPRYGNDIVRDFDKVRPYSEGLTLVSVRTPRKKNGFRPSPKRPTVNAVCELSKSYGPLARNVQPTRVDTDIVQDCSRDCDKVRSYTEGSMVYARTPGKENGFRPNLKRPRGNVVRELPRGYGRLARNVWPDKCEERYGYMNTLPKNNGRLHDRRVDTDIVRGFSVGRGRVMRRVQPNQKLYGDRNKLRRENVRLYRDRVDIDVVRDLSGSCDKVGSYSKFAKAKHLVVSLIEDKECEKLHRARNGVKQALGAYEEALTKLGEDPCDPKYRKVKGFTLHTSAAKYIKDKWVNTDKRIGDIPGVQVGDTFRYRPELVVVGLHRPYQLGIDYMKVGKSVVATSIVDSGRYANKTESADVLIYIGQGGNPKVAKGEANDQLAVRGNLALINSKAARYHVRVIKKYKISDKNGVMCMMVSTR